MTVPAPPPTSPQLRATLRARPWATEEPAPVPVDGLSLQQSWNTLLDTANRSVEHRALLNVLLDHRDRLLTYERHDVEVAEARARADRLAGHLVSTQDHVARLEAEIRELWTWVREGTPDDARQDSARPPSH